MPVDVTLVRTRDIEADGQDYADAVSVSATAYGADACHTSTATPDGGRVLVQYIPAAEWATLAPLVAARAPDAPLVSHLDTAGMRDCLRDAAVASEGD